MRAGRLRRWRGVRGLRARVMLSTAFVLVNGVIAVGITLNVLLTDRLNTDADAVLRARADAQATTIVQRGGRVVVREGGPDDAASEALGREAWVFAGGRTLAAPNAARPVQQTARALAAVRSTTTRDVAGLEVRLLAEPVRDPDGGRPYATVVVGLSLVPYEDTERLARTATILLGLLVVLAGVVASRRAMTAGLAPVVQMSRQAEDYGEHDLSARFDLGPPRDELTTLGATLDGLLGRLEASLRHEQRLSAEIAHELRTPLSGVRGVAELGLLEDEPDVMREALRSVITSADRMNAVVDALLQAARERTADPPGQAPTCLVREAVVEAVKAHAAAADTASVTVAVHLPEGDLFVAADRVIVSQAVSPLVENAVRHAAGRVDVRVQADGQRVRITVEDDGAGIAAADVDAVFDPGWQTAGGSGSGLGLALVRRLVASLGGSVRAEATDAGARIVLALPGVADTGS